VNRLQQQVAVLAEQHRGHMETYEHEAKAANDIASKSTGLIERKKVMEDDDWMHAFWESAFGKKKG
jgi:hypothetical protein